MDSVTESIMKDKKLVVNWDNIETVKITDLTGEEFEYWTKQFIFYKKHAIYRLYDSDNDRIIVNMG